jgi:hypothetical protein
MSNREALADWRTTRDVAVMHDVKVRDVQYHIKAGNIRAERVGISSYFYLIHKDDVPKVWPPNSVPPPQ